MTGVSSPFDVPAAFGRFRVLHQIGAGSLGPVFRGEDPTTAAVVAIKVIQLNLPPERAHEVADGLRALQERLPAHPVIAPIVGAGLHDLYPYVVSTLAPGQSLDVALREFGPAVLADALPRLEALAAGLDLAADAWSWHGDLHPRDIVIQDGQTTLLGLGIAPLIERSGARLATRRPYTAPEVASGGATSPESDQYALAAMAFEWLYGRQAPGPAGLPLDVPPLPGVDRQALAAAFTSALAPDPAARFDSCSAFVEALGAAVRDRAAAPAAPAGAARDRHVAPPVPLIEPDPEADLEPDVEPDLEPDPEPASVPQVAADPGRVAVQPPIDLAGHAETSELDTQVADLLLASEPRPSLADPHDQPDAVDAALPITPITPRIAAEPRARPRIDPLSVEPVAWQGGSFGSSSAGVRERRGFGALALIVALLIGAMAGAGAAFTLGLPGLAGLAGWPTLSDLIDGRQSASPPPAADTTPPPTASAPTTEPGAPAESDATRPPAAPPESSTADEPRETGADGGRLLIHSTPSGAEVSVDGTMKGVTPLALRDLPLGTHTVVFTRPGYARTEQRIALTRARPSRSVDARLVEEGAAAAVATSAVPPRATPARATPGTLVVESRPSGALVRIDGREAGTTPLLLEAVPPGPHTVTIVREGYEPWTTTVTIEPGARARVAASLGGLQ